MSDRPHHMLFLYVIDYGFGPRFSEYYIEGPDIRGVQVNINYLRNTTTVTVYFSNGENFAIMEGVNLTLPDTFPSWGRIRDQTIYEDISPTVIHPIEESPEIRDLMINNFDVAQDDIESQNFETDSELMMDLY